MILSTPVFFFQASQGKFDVSKTPDSKVITCPTHSLGAKTIAITHTKAVVRTGVTVTFIADTVGPVNFIAYVVVDRPEPQLGKWFQLTKVHTVLPYAPPPPPPEKSAMALEITFERAEAFAAYKAAGLAGTGFSADLDLRKVIFCISCALALLTR